MRGTYWSKNKSHRDVQGRGQNKNQTETGRSFHSHWDSSSSGTPLRQRGPPFHERQGRAFSHQVIHHGMRRIKQQKDVAQPLPSNYTYFLHHSASSESHRRSRRDERQQGLLRQQHEHEKYLEFPFLQDRWTVYSLPQFQVMFILRGLPGSGKSTVAEMILQLYKDKAVICSADYYRYTDRGEYVWQKDKLQETHSKCQRRAEKFCSEKKPIVVIDNTNVSYSEVAPYIRLARQYGYVVVLVEPRTPWKFHVRELVKRNAHNVSFSMLSRRLQQYHETAPLYFGWFLAPACCFQLKTLAKDILWKCLQVMDFKNCMVRWSGYVEDRYTVHNAMLYYTMKHSGHQNHMHITACYAPQRRYIASTTYNKCQQVVDALGQISEVAITGWVLTDKTFSARVKLTQEQQNLWMNEIKEKQNHRSAGDSICLTSCTKIEKLIEGMHLEEGEQNSASPLSRKNPELRPVYGDSATAHITVGRARDVSPVQAKYDVQKVVDHELEHHAFEEHLLLNDIGSVRKHSDEVWAVYLKKTFKVPVIFSGHYE